MGKKKIFNDPVYGFMSFPYEIIYDIIDHPYFQRLRRVSQMGFSHYVYPGALHTRFHHAMGALHLMTRALNTLIDKGVKISEEEAKAASIAILLHDIGHGPFSHALEGIVMPFQHEVLSLAYMNVLNEEYGGELDLAIRIFKDQYDKKFLHQLISGQLDVDRMDYLNRDSFFTGVAEGVIGYDRIIKMLNVVDDQLVVEEKGIYSIEKFLMSRRLMYLQVYLHKTSIAVEKMLVRFIEVLKQNIEKQSLPESHLMKVLSSEYGEPDKSMIQDHSLLDDVDVIMSLKVAQHNDHFVLKYLSESILKRKIFNVSLTDQKTHPKIVVEKIDQIQKMLDIDQKSAESLTLLGEESNQEYSLETNEIKIFMKNGDVKPFSSVSTYNFSPKTKKLYYWCTPRL